MLFSDSEFYMGLRNTLAISCLKLVFNTFCAITLAILLNEVRISFFKRTVQTISYLPHFVSWVVAANLVYTSLSPDGGIVNELLMKFHLIKEPIMFMGENKFFWGIAALSEVWKEVGWGAIIYLAAMTSIDPELYETASIDGAGRIRRIFAITIPGIMSTIKILLVLNIGFLLNAGMQQIYLLQNSANVEVSRILEIYILNYGLKMGRYSYATAAGIFNSIVSITLVFTANRISKRIDGEKLF
jgi:putative aldouronate transport system permease protein